MYQSSQLSPISLIPSALNDICCKNSPNSKNSFCGRGLYLIFKIYLIKKKRHVKNNNRKFSRFLDSIIFNKKKYFRNSYFVFILLKCNESNILLKYIASFWKWSHVLTQHFEIQFISMIWDFGEGKWTYNQKIVQQWKQKHMTSTI